MKKRLFYSLFLLALIYPMNAIAVSKSVTINWTMQDTANVLGYKVYYSYNNNMSGAIEACQTNNSSATSIVCDNVNIESYPVYFNVAAIYPDDEYPSNVKEISGSQASISIVAGFKIVDPGGGGQNGGDCSSDPFYEVTGAGTDVFDATNYANRMYSGGVWQGATKTICQVDFLISSTVGNLDNKNYVAKIFSTSGSNLGTEIGSSEPVSGAQSYEDDYTSFTFSTPVTLQSSYAIVLTAQNNTADSSNFFYLESSSTASGSMYEATWRDNKNQLRLDTNSQVLVKLYEVQ